MNRYLFILAFLVSCTSCQAQNKKTGTDKRVGGPCEGCEAIYEYGQRKLTPTDTLPAFQENEPKIRITGTVFKKDGKTPAENVIVYIYHTDRNGIYPTKGDERGWDRRHGFIRGWIKTGRDGKYTFYTFRPGAYPNGVEPEHIHILVKESSRNEYHIDEYVFDDDPLLNEKERNELENRGGSGIVKPIPENGMPTIRRDIILGLNIPHYE
ncbi:intradiol ring-cleavage dioxygenase [Parapedobacter sp. DT-150]|uniref:dioxygenase family protein n=1 Tax=Parapedobacter sp. DT-150 TaxID=3396162 RepID=UPI003F1C12EC